MECGQYSELVLQIEDACRRYFPAYGTVQDSHNSSLSSSTSHTMPKGIVVYSADDKMIVRVGKEQ
jgi:hypothetical protein